jgi:hypothetical protein
MVKFASPFTELSNEVLCNRRSTFFFWTELSALASKSRYVPKLAPHYREQKFLNRTLIYI